MHCIHIKATHICIPIYTSMINTPHIQTRGVHIKTITLHKHIRTTHTNTHACTLRSRVHTRPIHACLCWADISAVSELTLRTACMQTVLIRVWCSSYVILSLNFVYTLISWRHDRTFRSPLNACSSEHCTKACRQIVSTCLCVIQGPPNDSLSPDSVHLFINFRGTCCLLAQVVMLLCQLALSPWTCRLQGYGGYITFFPPSSPMSSMCITGCRIPSRSWRLSHGCTLPG